MSADNGIYILETPENEDSNLNEYRVCHMQCVDDLWYWEDKGTLDKINPTKLKERFGDCEIHHDKAAAYVQADQAAQGLLNNGLPLEYGINTIRYDLPFPKEDSEHEITPAITEQATRNIMASSSIRELAEMVVAQMDNNSLIQWAGRW